MTNQPDEPAKGAGAVQPDPGGAHEDSATPATPEGKKASEEEGEEA